MSIPNVWPTTTSQGPDNGLLRPRPQQSLGAGLTRYGTDTSTPVYSQGAGLAKLVAGGIGGLADGYEARQQELQRQALVNAVDPSRAAAQQPTPMMDFGNWMRGLFAGGS